MSWRDLLTTEESVCLPWTGGKSLHARYRFWKIKKFPKHYGWFKFTIKGRNAFVEDETEPDPTILENIEKGFLVGNRLVELHSLVAPNVEDIISEQEPVYLIEPGLDRFAFISAGRVYPEGPLIYKNEEFPPEGVDEVMDAFLDKRTSLDGIKHVPPGLECAFLMETWYRDEAEKRRIELARQAREEAERRAREQRRQQLREALGDGARRREMAQIDFEEAARAALSVGGAKYLDSRKDTNNNYIVKYRCVGQRLECICDENLNVIDAGVCLTDHTTGEKGDTYFTLESLPSVIKEADDLGVLVVWRHG